MSKKSLLQVAEEEFALRLVEASSDGVGVQCGGIGTSDVVIGGIAVSYGQSAYAGFGNHRAGVRKGYPCLGKGGKDVALEAVVRAACIAYAGTDESVTLWKEGFPSASEKF